MLYTPLFLYFRSNLVGYKGVHDFFPWYIVFPFINIVHSVHGPSYHMQAMFFSELYPSETRKLIERLVNYVIYKVSSFLFLWFMKCVALQTDSDYLLKVKLSKVIVSSK